MSCLDAAVVDESDPLASDAALDMYDERNGFKTPPAESRYAKDFIERYRVAQDARCARIDAIARRRVADAAHGRAAMRAQDFAASSADNRNYVGAARWRRTTWSSIARRPNPSYLDLSIDPSERAVGLIISAATRPGELLAVRPWPNRNA